MNYGTENIYWEDPQILFAGSAESFIYAESTINRRTKSFWSRLKKQQQMIACKTLRLQSTIFSSCLQLWKFAPNVVRF